jgi:hypothetical protein
MAGPVAQWEAANIKDESWNARPSRMITTSLCTGSAKSVQMFAQRAGFRAREPGVRLVVFTATGEDATAGPEHTGRRQSHVLSFHRNHHRHGLVDDWAIKKTLFNRHLGSSTLLLLREHGNEFGFLLLIPTRQFVLRNDIHTACRCIKSSGTDGGLCSRQVMGKGVPYAETTFLVGPWTGNPLAFCGVHLSLSLSITRAGLWL